MIRTELKHLKRDKIFDNFKFEFHESFSLMVKKVIVIIIT